MDNVPEGRLRLRSLIRNWISLAGTVIATGSFFAFLLLFAVDILAHHGNPYMGILAYVVAPGFLFLGIGLVVLGCWVQLKQVRQAIPGAVPVISIDLARPRDRKILTAFASLSVLFLFMTALGSYQTYHYTESVQFCGQACHVPMKPEFVTAQHSPHARVDCVACHVGPGAAAYIRTKVNGVRQLYHAVCNDFDRPIRLTADKQRPAQETCETCHWPLKYTGDLLRTNQHFLSDEKNTPFTVRLILKVGGGDPARGPVGGIHWHMNLANKVEFISPDVDKHSIPWVRFTDPNGVVTEYRSPDFKDDPSKYPIRRMDCMDCHNRPSHKFRTPNDAVDHALASGLIDTNIPWVKAKMVAALVEPYTTESEAMQKIDTSLKSAYPERKDVKAIVAETQEIYRTNFFPEMKADWRVHPDFIGHKEWDGCFRCHDGKHKTADGKPMVKANDCKSCHLIIAQGSGADLEKVNPAGYTFMHIDAEYSDFSCAECHTGATPKN